MHTFDLLAWFELRRIIGGGKSARKNKTIVERVFMKVIEGRRNVGIVRIGCI